MEVGLQNYKKQQKLGEKFLQNFISSRGGPVKVQKQGRDKKTQEDYSTHHGMMAERKTRRLLYISCIG